MAASHTQCAHNHGAWLLDPLGIVLETLMPVHECLKQRPVQNAVVAQIRVFHIHVNAFVTVLAFVKVNAWLAIQLPMAQLAAIAWLQLRIKHY